MHKVPILITFVNEAIEMQPTIISTMLMLKMVILCASSQKFFLFLSAILQSLNSERKLEKCYVVHFDFDSACQACIAFSHPWINKKHSEHAQFQPLLAFHILLMLKVIQSFRFYNRANKKKKQNNLTRRRDCSGDEEKNNKIKRKSNCRQWNEQSIEKHNEIVMYHF